MKRPPIPPPPYQGGCLCGAVRYSLNARPKAVNACHCTDCKKLSGATNLLVLIADRAAFSHASSVTDVFRKRADSGNEIDLVRCAACGVRLWHERPDNPEVVFIAAGTLADSTWAVPTSHIWTKRASAGVLLHEDALLCEGSPQTRQLLFDAFARIYGAAE